MLFAILLSNAARSLPSQSYERMHHLDLLRSPSSSSSSSYSHRSRKEGVDFPIRDSYPDTAKVPVIKHILS